MNAVTLVTTMAQDNLDGYQKKKYLAKVVFTYILGYKVDVGHMEAVNLISSQKYSEKQIVRPHSIRERGSDE